MTANFAVHPCDERRARQMALKAKLQKVSIDEILNEAKSYLSEQGCGPEFIADEIARVERFYKSLKFQSKKKSAWIVHWEYSDKPFAEDSIIAIFDSRKTGHNVADFVLQHYIAVTASLEEKVHYSSRLKDFPYQAEFTKVDSALWTGSITCGHNPFITARVVKNLTLSTNDKGKEMLLWDAIPKPKSREVNVTSNLP